MKKYVSQNFSSLINTYPRATMSHERLNVLAINRELNYIEQLIIRNLINTFYAKFLGELCS